MNTAVANLKPVLAALILGACSTPPTMPENAWKISPVQTVRHSGSTAGGYFALGRVKEAQGAHVQAVDAYRKALKADPDHVATWNALGALQMQLGRQDEGLQALERAVRLSPSSSHLHNNLGYALLLSGRNDDSANALRRAVELDTHNRRAWANLATAYRRQGSTEQAEFADAHATGHLTKAAASPANDSNRPAVLAQPVSLTPPEAHAAPSAAIGVVQAVLSAAESGAAVVAVGTAAPEKAEMPQTPAGIDNSPAGAGFPGLALSETARAAPPLITVQPRTEIVKVADNVFELRNGPPTHAASVAEAAEIIGAAIAPLPARVETPTAAVLTRAARYEIANGHGGEGLARRLATLMAEQGLTRPRLTNQRPYDQPTSVLQYRDGHRTSAEAFASMLPFRAAVSSAASTGLRVDVRLVLGRDLTTSDACAVLGLCTKVAGTRATKVVTAGDTTN